MPELPKPKTVSELLEFCSFHNMPLRQMRFFIGEDYPEPKAFGLFQAADGDYVVYKNKDDGSRAIRYKGPDEAFAVSEIYEKLKAETELRRNLKGQTGYSVRQTANAAAGKKRSHRSTGDIAIIVMVIICIFICVKACRSPDRGYYRNNGRYYYYDTDDWYYFDDGWYILEDDDWINDNYQDYYISDDYVNGYGADDFRTSEYYNGYYERSDDNGHDDYDWGGNDYGDWDAGDTDWKSDW